MTQPLPIASAPNARPMLRIEGLSKSFTLHGQGGTTITAFRNVDLRVDAGECVALVGPSGAGKSSVLRAVSGNYLAQSGAIWLRHGDTWVDMATADHRQILAVRRRTLGHVSQFLRVIPRLSALDVVAEPLTRRGVPAEDATRHAADLLHRLRIDRRLMALAPATFSGGEQQRVNIARGLIADPPILLLDEPTASLDKANRDTVVALIDEAKARGAAILGIFHDADVRDQVADRVHPMTGEHPNDN